MKGGQLPAARVGHALESGAELGHDAQQVPELVPVQGEQDARRARPHRGRPDHVLQERDLPEERLIV